MATQLELARKGEITSQMRSVAEKENFELNLLVNNIKAGKVAIPNNSRRKSNSVGIGKGLKTKINASIGTSSDIIDLDMEVKKAIMAEQSGADTLMELSTAGDLDLIRREVLSAVKLPVGTVPLYQAFFEAISIYGGAEKMPEDLIFDVIEKQCNDGISFMAIHCGINRITLERLRKQGYRHGGLVSRGGAFLTAWMEYNNKENPLYEKFDRVIDILKKYDTVLSLGNGMRAGAVHDSTDRAQIQELIINCELADYAHKKGVQVIVEGPGHIPIDEIEANVLLQKKLSNEKPFYMLGPIPTDVFPGYDHITSAIGASLSTAYGADFICYVTPPEHLALPLPEDVKEGVITAKIASYIGDMIKYKNRGRDLAMGHARRDLNWEKQMEICLTPETAKQIRCSRIPTDKDTCTMCGKFCSLKEVNKYFADELEAGTKK